MHSTHARLSIGVGRFATHGRYTDLGVNEKQFSHVFFISVKVLGDNLMKNKNEVKGCGYILSFLPTIYADKLHG